MAEAHGVTVDIMGRELKIACSEDEREALLNAVGYLDKKMSAIRDTGKVVGVERIAIMAALNITHELLTAPNGGFDISDYKRRIEAMQQQIDLEIIE
ncbi:MAG: cell division protein ZapA [Methylophilaceae bacterium]|nr:cell division protein ZapA [Methylophilaceae bacterium]